jgi:deferrochelatase/peroxidase EfeB
VSTHTAAVSLDLGDIQGNIVRGYRMPNARHFILGITDPAGAASLIGGMLSGDEAASPQVTTADHWTDKPEYCLNIGLTWAGLAALGLPAGLLQNFPAAFRRGPAPVADALGDQGAAAPEHWRFGGPATPAVHMVLSLFTSNANGEQRERQSRRLRALFADGGVVEVAAALDADGFPHGKVHFGYDDGIAQPRIRGAPGRQRPDMQPEAEPGDFLLGCGYLNTYNGNYLGNLPPELCSNGTYGALRVLQQDVFAFERFINLAGQRYGLDAEYVAAKLMGRWRNGVPLTVAPESGDVHMPAPRLNEFAFTPGDDHPAYYDDTAGTRCPVGAHIRRLNPRGAPVMGKPHSRRIIRRGIPYGPEADFERPDDVERGLIGYFICGDLEMQFEFLCSVWANSDISAAGVRGTRDPILGAQPPFGGQFVVRTADARDPIIFDNVPRLVTTRASAYCFLPGIRGLHFLSGL